VKLFIKTCICTECGTPLLSFPCFHFHPALRSYLTDELPPFVPPALWLCPMRVGASVRDTLARPSLAAEPKYKKYLDWVQSPPDFPAISINSSAQRSSGPITSALGARVVMSDAQEMNASADMRLYIDERDPSNAILKISPHVTPPPLPPPPPPLPLLPPLPHLSPPDSSPLFPFASRSFLTFSRKILTRCKEAIPSSCAIPSTGCRAAWD
jgi:hypothetical protein